MRSVFPLVMEAALDEKQLLIREMNHRIKNNLSLVGAMLSLQARRFPDAGVREELGNAVARIHNLALVHIDDLDALDELDVLLGRLKEAFDKRNAVVHHMWCRDPETGNIVMVKETARVRVEVKSIPMSADQVKVDALFVYDAGMALFSFLKAHNLLPPFPTALRPRWHPSKEERKKRREREPKP